MIKPKHDIAPQRFRWRGPGFFRWKYGACVYNGAFDLWEIHTFGHASIMTFEECPWEIIGQVVCDCSEFEWIDNEMEWFGP